MQISNFNRHPQKITCSIKYTDAPDPIQCPLIYARCTRLERIHLWDALISLSDSNHGPWIVGRDFNLLPMLVKNLGSGRLV